MHAKCGVEPGDTYHEGDELGFLLVHRLGGTPVDLDYVGARLAAAGHTVLCPLLFGHGGSRALLGATTWQQWYSSVTEGLDELKEHCSSIVVAGLSGGASLALMLAAERRLDVAGIVLYAPTFMPSSWTSPWYGAVLRRLGHKGLANMFRVVETAPYGIKDDALRREIIDRSEADGRARSDVHGRPGGAILEAHWAAATAQERLAAITQPSLIFHARADDRDGGADSYMLQQRLNGITDVIVLEDTYHLITADHQRDLVVERTLEFAGKLLDGGPQPPPIDEVTAERLR